MILITHVVFAGFFLPAALTFAITGGLYTFGIRGSYETKSLEIPLTLQTDPNLPELISVAKQVLLEHFHGEVPSGEPAVKKTGTSWNFEWTGARADFVLEPTTNSGVYKVSLKKTGFHRFFVQLHKAKGGWPFKVLAGGLAVAFVLLFASGVAIALTRPRETKRLIYSLSAGTAVFLICLYLS